MTNRYFILFACCIPVSGAKRNIICDLQRSKYINIPDSLYFILTEYRDKSISFIKAQFSKEYSDRIAEYFRFLVENEFGFFSDTYKEFGQIETSVYHEYKIISNAIVDYDNTSNYSIKNVIDQLSGLLCESLELRFFSPVSLDFIETTLQEAQGSTLRSINLIVHHAEYIDESYCFSLSERYPRLSLMVVHSSESNLTRDDCLPFMLHFVKEKIHSESCCGVVSPSYFVINTKSFIESKNHNSCLYKKISVDKNGFIKNCPSMKANYGNIDTNTLEDAVEELSFKEFWNVTKDDVEICSDCEFRYICPDCRVYLTSDNKLSKPAKCGYNPYE